jgi:HlyD family secretion protein
MKSYFLPILAVLCVVAAVGWTYSVQPIHQPTLPSAPPPESPANGGVAGVGLVEPESENVQISCAVSGLVTGLYVKAGDHVSKGQRLFSLDDRELTADLGVKKAMVAAAEARLMKLEDEPRPEEIPTAEAKVTEAAALLADARVQVRLIESVTDRRAVKEEDVERRRLNYEAAAAKLEQAKNDLALLKAGAWKPDVDVARADAAQAAASVRQDEINISRLTVEAPVNGTILQNKVRLGQYAQCGPLAEPLMIFGGGKNLHLRAQVDENDAWRVREGAQAVAHLRGESQAVYSLEFVRFEPYVVPKASLTGDTTERVDTRVLEVIYRFKDPEARVFDGQQMDVYIDAATRKGPQEAAQPLREQK